MITQLWEDNNITCLSLGSTIYLSDIGDANDGEDHVIENILNYYKNDFKFG